MRPKILLQLGSFIYDRCITSESWERFERLAEPVGRGRTAPYEEDKLLEALRSITGIMSFGGLLPYLSREILKEADSLKIIGVWGDRFGKELDLGAAHELGIKVVDVDNITCAQPVAEWVLGLILACLRNAGEIYRRMTTGTEEWLNTLNDDFVNGELTERSVGLIGCGHVGKRFIELLVPFRVNLKVYDPYLRQETVEKLKIQRGELDEVIQHSEILVVQVPHTPTTEGMIGRRELNLIRKGAILINCSRGKVVDSDALIEKLEKKEIIAGLDVFDPEPLPKDSPLRTIPNAILSPHIGWCAQNAFPRCFDMMLDEFERFFQGIPLEYELTQRMVDLRNQ
jgi:phosphoglycerate dehydrogenase-like enzyme